MAEPESAPEAALVPAADAGPAPAQDASADEVPEDVAAPAAGETGQAQPDAEAAVAGGEPAMDEAAGSAVAAAGTAAGESGSVGAVAMEAEPAGQPMASEAPAEAGAAAAAVEPVTVAWGPAPQDAPPVVAESEAVAGADEAPAAAADDGLPQTEADASGTAAGAGVAEGTPDDVAAEAVAPAQEDTASDTAAPGADAPEAGEAEGCAAPVSEDAAPAAAVAEGLSEAAEALPGTGEAAAAVSAPLADAAREEGEAPLSVEASEAAVGVADAAAGDDRAAAMSMVSDEAAEGTVDAGTEAAGKDDAAGTQTAQEGTAREDAGEGAEEASGAAAPRRSWWQRIFGSDEDAARPEAAAQAGGAGQIPAAAAQGTVEEVRPEAVEAAEAKAELDESAAAAPENAGQGPLAGAEESVAGAAAATAEQGGAAADVMPGAALAATAAAAKAATAERPAAPALDACGLDPALAQSLILRLREAEPRLSVWLGIVLEGVEEAGDELWKRLRFLLRSLDAPAAEVDAFVDDFRGWLERMEYVQLDEFRSELQYRLTLALDMEDEEDERSRLFLKISEGLSRTREQFSRRLDSLFSSHGELDESFWEELEELFIMADLGYEPSLELVERLRERARKENVTRVEDVRGLLMAEVDEIFRLPRRISAVNPPEVVLFIGVNGVGKTTTIAKLAHRARMQGKKVMIAAADTFRAAAIEQLQVWAERVGALFHSRPAGSDPASVAYEAMDRALAEKVDILFVDTAGRLQTKVNLMEELTKIRQVLGKKHEGAPHRCVLVIDATTGQNALSQAKLFKEAAGVDELILTKLDGTAKGGVAIAVAMQEKLPITYVGLGEKLEDLRPFNGEDYARALLGGLEQGR